MCVKCYITSDGGAYIRATTNGLPDHCYFAPSNPPMDYLIDFMVLFNTVPAKSNGYAVPVTSITTESQMNQQLCDSKWPRNSGMPDASHYVLNPGSASDDRILGITLNGVFLFSGTSEYEYDAFYPRSYGNRNAPRKAIVDICLGSSQ